MNDIATSDVGIGRIAANEDHASPPVRPVTTRLLAR
jgi:hypothetical protein